MNNVTFGLNDIVEMKKPHPCGTNEFKPKVKQIESIREYLKIKKLEGVKYDI